jgi:hypothetical protein
MVTENYNATESQADEILADVMNQGGIWEVVESGIEILCEFNHITENE